MSDWDDIYTCPACGNKKCVPPHNPMNSSVLIIGEFPGKEEEIQGVPLVGRTGTILRQQLFHLGWDISQFGLCNLWQHEPNKNPDCLELGRKTVIQEAKGKDIVLLVGSDVAKMFLTKNVSDVNGMIVNEFLTFPFSAKIVMAMFNPAIVFHGVHGEIVLALRNFIQQVEKL